ncbi:MAG TPA: TolC family protein [Chitinophagales bacterium]|nr:TolC family protein [Chitinophagales bacterium]
MKRLLFSAFAILLSATQFLSAQTTTKWTLETCIDYAFKHNIQVRQAEVLASVSKNDNLQSKLNLLPSVDGSLTFSNNFGNGFNPQTYSFAEGNSQSLQASLQAGLPIFTGLQQIYNIERTKYELIASKFDYENSKRNIALSVASSYLQILLNKEILKVAEKQKLLTQDQNASINARIRAGSLPETSGYDFDAQLARDEANVVAAQNAVDLATLSLKQLLQLNDETFVIEVPEIKLDNVEDITALTSASIYQSALGTQPSILSAEARLKSANASRKIAYGALSPTISVFGNLSAGYFSQDALYRTRVDTINLGGTPFYIPSNDFDRYKTVQEGLKDNFRKVIGVSLNVPLFSKWQRVTNIQNARLQMQIRELQLEGTKNQFRVDIEQAYTNTKAAIQSYVANSKAAEAANKSYTAFEKRFGAGMLGTFDLQQSKNNVAIAESEMIKAKYTYVFRQKVLDFYQGKPLRLESELK